MKLKVRRLLMVSFIFPVVGAAWSAVLARQTALGVWKSFNDMK
jgi:hypothetical protein